MIYCVSYNSLVHVLDLDVYYEVSAASGNKEPLRQSYYLGSEKTEFSSAIPTCIEKLIDISSNSAVPLISCCFRSHFMSALDIIVIKDEFVS